MKKLFFLLFALASVVIAAAQDKPEGLFINSKAPDFKIKDQSGIDVALKDLRKKGQTVLIFFRGSWCPYCNRHLKALQDSLMLIKDKGAQVVAITPEASAGIDSTVAKTGAVFPILHDVNGVLAKAYGVGFKVDERTVNRYKMAGVDLLKANEQKEAVLPVPAVYIINSEGTITYRHFDENYRRRLSVKEIVANLK